MGSRLFRSTDIGAPQLDGMKFPNNTLIPLLKAVLVNGYGDIEPLGYTLEFEDADTGIAVFRQPEGSRQYLKFDESDISVGYYCEFMSYETMSSISDGISPCPPLSENTHKFIVKSENNNDEIIPWVIIGDKKGFYFIPNYSKSPTVSLVYNNACHFHWFGDYSPFSQEDRDIFCCVIGNQSLTNFFSPSLTVANSCFFVSRYRDRRRGSRNLGIFTQSSQQKDYFGAGALYRPPGNALMFTTPWVTEIFSTTSGDIAPWDDIMGAFPMAFLPGLQNILGNLRGYTDEEEEILTRPHFVTENGENRYFIFCTNGYNSLSIGNLNRICIRLGEDFRNV